jgi:transcription termination factor Rho
MSVEHSALERSALERKDREELTTIAQALGAKPPSRARKAEIVQLILELTGVESSDASAGAGDSGAAASAADAAAGSAAAGGAAAGGAAKRRSSAPAKAPAGKAASAAGDDDGGDEGQEAWEFGGTTDVVDAPSVGNGGGGQEAEGAGNGTSGSGRDGTKADATGGEGRAEAGDAKGDQDKADKPKADKPKGDGPKVDGPKGDARSGAASSGQGGQQGNQGQGNQGQGKQGQGNQGQGNPGQGNQGQGTQGQGNQGQGNQGGDGGTESGNRRRRRRGRRGKDGDQGGDDFAGEPVAVEGLLDLREEGYGFLRVHGSLPSKDDIYVSVKQVRQFGLRRGDHVSGASRPAMRNEKNPALLRIDKVNGVDPDQARGRRRFEDLTPLFPDERLPLETRNSPENMTARIVDLLSPVGKGQRGLIVSPPKAGKTAIVKQVARSIETNNPEVALLVLLVDERPEEVTDMRRWLRNPSSEVVASTFDRPPEEHTQVAELTIERAKRLVEDGRDVCIILDGITRLARAYNQSAPATGRIMSGGVDAGAIYPPKKFFGAARNIEEGGSLTILATALVETGSKMDEVIFEEFKGTGNMELRLDRRLAERRIYPAIAVDASSTRHEELLFDRKQLEAVWALRRVLSGLASDGGGNAAGLEMLIDRMKTFRTNDEFLAEVSKSRLAS